MGITLFVEPQTKPISWDEFKNNAKDNSVALDGYVADAPNFDAHRRIANFNHHENVNRLFTLSTCQQVWYAINQDFFESYRINGRIHMNIYVNDCDEDVCTSVFLLRNPQFSNQAFNPKLSRLIGLEGVLDATAGSWKVNVDLPFLKKLLWIYKPYKLFRASGQIDKKNKQEFIDVIDNVERRIIQYMVDDVPEIDDFDTSYNVIQNHGNWCMVEEIGAYAHFGMYANGIKAYVTSKQRTDGRWSYVIGKTSPFIPYFNVLVILNRLNSIEPGWGGSDTIGGSPRVEGSGISPNELEKIINDILNE